ncbi:MAG: hypothetical protein VXW32_11595 [Myxococcota bacterium]|nr:hypothetical protein [Myxococcota bacterium]
MIGLLLLACSFSVPERPTDIESYTLASVAEDLSSGLTHCSAIRKPALQAECIAFQVREHARNHTEASQAACAAIPAGIWRDECFFLLADGAIEASQPEKTATFCKEAGRYFQPCFMHLFKAHAGFLRSELPHGAAHQAYERAVALGGPEAPKDFAHRAWSVFFRSSGGEDRLYDTTACTDLGDRSRACVSGVREALIRRLNRTTASPDLCTLDPINIDSWVEHLREKSGIAIAKDTGLLAVLEPYYRRHCPPHSVDD